LASPPISAKQAEAGRVYAQVQALDVSLARADEQVNLANYKLSNVQQEIALNDRELRVAKHNLTRSQRLVAQRLVALYTTPPGSTLEVILGAKTLDDVLTAADAANRVSSLDSEVLSQVSTFRTAVMRHGAELASAKAEAQRLIRQRGDELRSVQSQLTEQRQLLSTIQGQIATLEAEQRARELQSAQAAQARLAQAQPQAPVIPSAIAGAFAQTPFGTPAPPASQYSGVVGVAMSFLGVPYVWGGAAPGGFDCSGLVMYAYAQVGVSLPHSSYAQWAYGVPVSKADLQPGDIVFFDGLGHEGIYIGGGEFIHAPHTGDVVRVGSLSEAWFADTWVGARRIL
jgi:cell wall-associated NlpC family hydrolase